MDDSHLDHSQFNRLTQGQRSELLPQPTPQPASIAASEDVQYPGLIRLAIDATDTSRGIIRARQIIPVAKAGKMTLLYPKWMPGYHSPQNPIELLAGLEITAGEQILDWRRDPVEVYAFHIDVPDGIKELTLTFQFLSPTSSSQGEVVVTTDMLSLQWGRMLIYPAGHFARCIEFEVTATLPDGWAYATALAPVRTCGAMVIFEPTALDRLVDSPLMAGSFQRRIPLDDECAINLALVAHEPDALQATTEQVELHRQLIVQADKLFGTRHFDHYHFLVALIEELGGGGVEHHQSAEIITAPDYFTAWDRNLPKRDVMAHEFTHSWNGKFRRGADSWTPSFDRPIRNSLMWVYEGQTQYWGHVLTTRSGLWPLDLSLGALAKVAATYDVRPGGLWRTMADTTRDPIIAEREPLPWPSWQRSEDYYSQGQLMWLSVDTLIRELSGDQRSLDDFARAFFGAGIQARTYEFEDVAETLAMIAPYDWTSFLKSHLESRTAGAPLEGLERGGYRLVYRDVRNEFCERYDALLDQFDARFSIGLTLSSDGAVQEVMWGSPAFEADMTAASHVETVDGLDYSERVMTDAIERAMDARPIRLSVKVRGRPREVDIAYSQGHRFPHLVPIEDRRRRLDEILTAL